ncbi:MAG: glucose-6-phosphate isomerase [Ruminococcaceae bacterium]|nr:glucose-6-phosphate isomerase [Oscillospiraceae bacterium]
MINLRYKQAKSISESDIAAFDSLLKTADGYLREKNGLGNDFLGWRDLGIRTDSEEYLRIKAAASRIRANSDILLVVGIGGSYLGARAVIEYLMTPYHNQLNDGNPEIYFLGNSFSGSELNTVLKLCEGKRVSVNVISKSGTTTESAVAFRILREYMESRYGKKEAAERIIATTDANRGALLSLAKQEGYECFVIPDDVGGRFSVLTAVGLLPAAVAGVDTDALLNGAVDMRNSIFEEGISHPAYKYATLRNVMLAKGKTNELLVSYDPDFRFMGEWFKQLFGESEGKDKKGLFPASVTYSSDLHSLGQFVQDGSPILFETIVRASRPESDSPAIPYDEQNGDGLNFLCGMTMDDINEKAMMGTLLAHRDGGTESFIIDFGGKDAYSLGELIYFFFASCAISGYMLEVNPFDQPGVEAYKKNMFALLGKPGYDSGKEELLAKIAEIEA